MPADPPTDKPADTTAPAGATVLIVDDERDERDIMARILGRRGFATLAAADSDEALAICRDQRRDIDLLLTDLHLPATSGADLARQATELRPRLRVLYVTGLPREVAVEQALIGESTAMIQKPFGQAALADAVRQALDGGRQTA